MGNLSLWSVTTNESSLGKIGYEEVGMKPKVFLNFYKFSVTVATMVLTYQNGENSIRFSNGEQTKYVEFIHGGLLRIYTEKNSEELVKLDYKKQNVAYKVVGESPHGGHDEDVPHGK